MYGHPVWRIPLHVDFDEFKSGISRQLFWSCMRILIWHWGRKGAGPLYTLQMAKALKHLQRGSVALSYSVHNELVNEFRSLALPSLEIKTFRTTLEALPRSLLLPHLQEKFFRFIREQKVDVVYCPMWHPWNAAMVARLRKVNIPYVLTIHDGIRHLGDSGPLDRWLERYEQERADAFVALSQFVKDQLDRRPHQPPFGTTLIPLPNLELPKPSSRIVEQPDSLNCLFIGRIKPYKGLDLLLDAFSLASKSRPGIHLTIAGEGNMARHSGKLQKFPSIDIHNRWLPDHEFAGLLQNHDVVILPYLEATQSGVISAAFGAGKPVVAFAVGGVTEQVRHGTNGLLVKDKSAEGLARTILDLANDQKLLRRLKIGAKNQSARHTTWENSAASVTQLCRTVLSPT